MSAGARSWPDGQSLLDASPQAAALVDAVERTILHVNPAFTALTGYQPGVCAGANALFMVGSGADPVAIQTLREALLAVRPCSLELSIEACDGRALPVRMHVQPSGPEHLLLAVEDLAALHRVRDSLRANDARLQAAMKADALAMWDWDVERDEVCYNPQLQQVLGVDPTALLERGELAERLLLPADRPEILAEFERHFHGASECFRSEYLLAAVPGTSSGRQRWVSVRAEVTRRDAAGRAQRVIGVVRDVSARRIELEQLAEAHARWERAVRGTSDGLYDWNLHTGHVWYGARFREIVGYGEEEFVDTFSAFQEVLHKDDRALVLQTIRRHLEDQSALDLRCRVVTRSGATIWCRLRGQSERDAAGRPLRLSGSLSDITAQIAAEQALGRSQDFYGTVLDSLPFYVAYVDRSEHVAYANRPFQEFFRMPLAATRGQAVREVIGERLYTAIAARFAEAFQGRTVESQGPIRAPNGQLSHVESIFLPHFDEAGAVLGCFVAARDVTEKHQLEAELRQSQKMEAIGRLTGGIAHDFNNLLAVIVGNMQLLARSLRDDSRLHRQAETALKAAMRGADLTRRLLAFARQQVLEPRVVNLDTLIGGMFELLRRSLTGDIEIRQVSVPTLWPVKIDPGQLENAVLNLVINARDAMPDGGAIIISTRNEVVATAVEAATVGDDNRLQPGEYTVLEVLDTGAGMSPQTLKRVFEPFFTTKDVGKGSGLGLPMVYGFVRQSGGHVRIDSTQGKGTSVQLFLPRAQVAADTAVRETPVASDSVPAGWETILVVEDNPEVRATAVDILNSLGYRVLEAANGYQALEQFMQHSDIALVFSDVMLPGGLPGPMLVDKLRERRPSLKVLMTSAFSESSILNRQLLDGTVQLLTKPYNVADLARQVRSILDGKEVDQRVPA